MWVGRERRHQGRAILSESANTHQNTQPHQAFTSPPSPHLGRQRARQLLAAPHHGFGGMALLVQLFLEGGEGIESLRTSLVQQVLSRSLEAALGLGHRFAAALLLLARGHFVLGLGGGGRVGARVLGVGGEIV